MSSSLKTAWKDSSRHSLGNTLGERNFHLCYQMKFRLKTHTHTHTLSLSVSLSLHTASVEGWFTVFALTFMYIVVSTVMAILPIRVMHTACYSNKPRTKICLYSWEIVQLCQRAFLAKSGRGLLENRQCTSAPNPMNPPLSIPRSATDILHEKCKADEIQSKFLHVSNIYCLILFWSLLL